MIAARCLIALVAASLVPSCGSAPKISAFADAGKSRDAGEQGNRSCSSHCEVADWPAIVVARTGEDTQTELTISFQQEGRADARCEAGTCPPPKFYDGKCTCGFGGTPNQAAQLTARTLVGEAIRTQLTVPNRSCPKRVVYVALELNADGLRFQLPQELTPCE